ncbi:MAG: hypothetical protein ACTSSB_08105 [Candidatus Heimdallarchaeota archaeon]
MEKKKSLCFLLLSITLVLVGVQIASVTGVIAHEVMTSKSNFVDDAKPIFLAVENPMINTTGPLENPAWFWLNFTFIVVITPALFIVPSLLIKDKKDDEVEDEPKTAIITENNLVARMGWMALFVQNILILLMIILFFVLIPVAQDAQLQVNILKSLLILWDLDFIAGILFIIGLILLSLKASKGKIYAYIGAAAWLIFIGTAIYPRISMLNLINSIEAFDFNEMGDFAIQFTGVFLFLQNLGHCFFAVAIFNTVKFLHVNSQIRGKGITNAFGITNYVVGSLGVFILTLITTYGNKIEITTGASLMILYSILYGIKYFGVPIIGIIAGILAFNQMKPKTT